MSTLSNAPQYEEGSDFGVGILFGFVVVFVVSILFYVYVFPGTRTNAITNSTKETTSLYNTNSANKILPIPNSPSLSSY